MIALSVTGGGDGCSYFYFCSAFGARYSDKPTLADELCWSLSGGDTGGLAFWDDQIMRGTPTGGAVGDKERAATRSGRRRS